MGNPSVNSEITQAYVELGRIGGLAATKRKAVAARRNGKKGGRPRKIQTINVDNHKIYVGDVRKVVPTLPDNYYDGLLSDAPYELGLLNKKWDSSGVAFNVDVWQELYRVLKPGAYLLVFSAPRTQHKITQAIEDAGFEVRDVLMWLYGSGFPKHKSLLKPSYEPIVLARKPGKKSLPLNIDGSRIGNESVEKSRKGGSFWKTEENGSRHLQRGGSIKKEYTEGRWPNNVIIDSPVIEQNMGDALKYFYCPKASRTEKDAGLDEFEPVKAGTTQRGFIADAGRGWRAKKVHNPHPTVKPLMLTAWLAGLILSSKSKRLLVPFSGTGSEMIGGIQSGWSEVTGIEISPEFSKIAEARINHWSKEQEN